MPGFEDLFLEERRIPLSDASAYLVELFRPTDFPEPVRTPAVEAGLLKMAVVQDVLGDSPEGLAEAERLSLVDPQVQAAMDYAQMRRERDEFMQQNQVLTQQLQQQQQAAQQAQQQMQSTQEQASQLQQLLQNEQAQREQATIQAVQVKDQSLQEQMAAAQKRQELFGLADGLKMQLDQLRAGADQVQQGIDQLQQSSAEAPADMQMRQQQEQQAMAQQQQAEEMAQMPPEQRKEVEEAQKAQGKAQEQTAQAEQSQAQGQQQQQEQQAQALQQQGQQAEQQAQPQEQQQQAAKTAALLRKIAANPLRAVRAAKEIAEAPSIREGAVSVLRREGGTLSRALRSEPAQLYRGIGGDVRVDPLTRGPGGAVDLRSIRSIEKGGSVKRGKYDAEDRKLRQLLPENQMPKAKEAAESAAAKDPNVKAKKDIKLPDEVPITEPANLNKVESPEEHEKKGMARIFKLAADVETARALGENIGIMWDRVDFTPADLAEGMGVEREHNRGETDVVPDERVDITTAKIALAHLRERGDYYKLLKDKVEDAPMPKEAGGEYYEATDFNRGEGNVAAMDCARQQKVTYPNITAGEGGDAIRKALEYIAKEKHRGGDVLPAFLDPQQPAIKPEDREKEEKIKSDGIVVDKGEPTTVKKLAAVLAERLRRAAR